MSRDTDAPSFPAAPPRVRALGYYLLLSYVALLINLGFLLRDVGEPDLAGGAFLGAVFLTYGVLYLLPLALILGLVTWLTPRRRWWAAPLRAGAAVLSIGTLQFGIYVDVFLHHTLGFHVNGFVLNVITTPGGLESTGGTSNTWWTLGAIGLGFVALQALLLRGAGSLARLHPLGGRRRWVPALGCVLLVALGAAERTAYGFARFYQHPSILVASHVFPLYVPTTFSSLLERVGFARPQQRGLRLRVGAIKLDYPRQALTRREGAPNYNLVWLVAESLRADALTPELMPQTTAFSQGATRFERHLSGGNGTRWGMFSMFYGLYGSYWRAFLDERRGPVLVDELLARDYQLSINTSARFTYPEFDATLFAAVPDDVLHESDATPLNGWACDRENVGRMLDFVDRRDPQRPFFAFQFFESSHAPYAFPPESVIRPDYTREYNYVSTDPATEAPGLRARYDNAVHHLDSQLGRVFEHLAAAGLLETTIVVVTGDHGEEFFEHGRVGHNSQFSDEQVRVPLLIHVPGHAPRVVDRLTSHLDLPATVLTALGVSTPPADYSLGHDLFGEARRRYAVLTDWERVAYVDEEVVATFSLSGYGSSGQGFQTRDGVALKDPAPLLEHINPELLEVMAGLRRFSR